MERAAASTNLSGEKEEDFWYVVQNFQSCDVWGNLLDCRACMAEASTVGNRRQQGDADGGLVSRVDAPEACLRRLVHQRADVRRDGVGPRGACRRDLRYGEDDRLRDDADGVVSDYGLPEAVIDRRIQLRGAVKALLATISLIALSGCARVLSGGSGVPTVPGFDGSVAACRQRLAEIGRAVDDIDRHAQAVRAEAGNCAADVLTLSTCQAELRVCERLR